MFRKKQSLLLPFIILIVLFIPGLKLSGFIVRLDIIVLISLILYTILKKNGAYLLITQYFFIETILFLIFIISGISACLILGKDLFIVLKSFIYPIVKSYILYCFILSYCYKHKICSDTYNINYYLLICFFIDSIFKLIEWKFSYIKVFWLNLINLDSWWNDTLGYRNLGLSGISIYDYSFAAVVCISIGIYSFKIYNANSILMYCKNFVLFSIVAVSAFLSGRTAFIVMGVFLSIFFFKTSKSILKFIPIFIILPICFLIIFPSFFSSTEFFWIIEPINNALNGNFSTESTNDLIDNHLFIPDNLFGYGIWAQFGDQINSSVHGSDSGFILSILFSGWLGFIFLIFSSIIITIRVIFSSFMNINDKKIFISFILSNLIVMIKGPIFFTSINAFIFFILLTPLVSHRMRRYVNEPA
ncbi:hypothetical protein I2492_16450 [Budviciaceae bacterium CWB-B4]|uniref:Uncharacterized protein n=1 Tax=Limnobaculum xujianqingii TaxID=2738837 RepID=A0A9D7AKJ9_9GAMM|nr:hypothetical protein [Limnobaculum xujianqingii]MBK5074420.1 hypothetical protein [Limnobaculum xujianqingii]MBK5177914.1 hypothetical protein [Limnobaculum xujianqingii]